MLSIIIGKPREPSFKFQSSSKDDRRSSSNQSISNQPLFDLKKLPMDMFNLIENDDEEDEDAFFRNIEPREKSKSQLTKNMQGKRIFLGDDFKPMFKLERILSPDLKRIKSEQKFGKMLEDKDKPKPIVKKVTAYDLINKKNEEYVMKLKKSTSGYNSKVQSRLPIKDLIETISQTQSKSPKGKGNTLASGFNSNSGTLKQKNQKFLDVKVASILPKVCSQ